MIKIRNDIYYLVVRWTR